MSSWVGHKVLKISTKEIGTVIADANGYIRILNVEMQNGRREIIRLNNVKLTKGTDFAWRFTSTVGGHKAWVPFDDGRVGEEVDGPTPEGE